MAPGEVQFFNSKRFALGRHWYSAHFDEAGDRPLAGEKSPEYLYLPAVPARIAEMIGRPKLIAVLRNPVDRGYSAYWHAVRFGLTSGTFEEWLSREDLLLAQRRYGFAPIDRGRYYRQLRRYERRFGRDALHILLYEDLVARRDASLDELARFLDIERPAAGWTFPMRNVARAPALPATLQRMAERSVNLLPAHRRWRVMRRLTREFTPPPMRPETRASLVATFQRENDALANWLDRDLTAWNS